MALNSSGAISLGGSTIGQSVQLETHAYGVTNGTATISLNDSYVRTLAGVSNGTISLNNLYGKTMPTTTVVLRTPGSSSWTVPPGVTSITISYPTPHILTYDNGTASYDAYNNYQGQVAPYYDVVTLATMTTVTKSVTPGTSIPYTIGAFTPSNVTTDVTGTTGYTYSSSAASASSIGSAGTIGVINTTAFDVQIENHAGNQDANFFVTSQISAATARSYQSSGYYQPYLASSPTTREYYSVRYPWTYTSGKTTVSNVVSPSRYSNSGTLSNGANGQGITWSITDQCCHGDLQGHLSLRPVLTSLIDPLMDGDTWDATRATIYWRHLSSTSGGVNPARIYNLGRNGTTNWWYNYQTNENGYSEGLLYWAVGFAMISYFKIQY